MKREGDCPFPLWHSRSYGQLGKSGSFMKQGPGPQGIYLLLRHESSVQNFPVRAASISHDPDVCDFPAVRIQHVNGASHAGVEGVNGPQDLNGLFWIGHGRTDQCLFPGSALAPRIAR